MIATGRALLPLIGRAVLLSATLLSALCAAVLFLNTGRPIPRSIEPLDAFENNSSTCISPCGRLAIRTIGDGPHFGLNRELEVWQIWPWKKVSTIKCSGGYLCTASLNTTQNLLAVSGHLFLEVKRWPSGGSVWECKHAGGINPNIIVFSKDGTRLIICTDDYAPRVVDSTTGKWLGWHLDTFDEAKGSFSPVVAAYFDSRDQPKGIIYKNDALTVWDIVTQHSDFHLHDKENSQTFAELSQKFDPLRNCLVSPDSLVLATGHQDGKVRIWSLENGSLIRTVRIAASGPCFPICFAADGRFISVLHTPEINLERWKWWISKLPHSWTEQAERILAGAASTTLVDLQTGKRWPGFTGTELCAFAGDGSTLLTWEKELAIWDVPPKWSYFTPWVWGALASFVFFGALWQLSPRGSRK